MTGREGTISFPRMSRLPFELLLALRYLRPKRTFVSVITLISVLGVTLGVAVLIIVISVMSGFDYQLRGKILGFSPHLRIMQDHSTMQDYPGVVRKISANPAVQSVAPYVLGQVLLETEPESGQSQVAAPWLRGIDARLESNVFSTNIVMGQFDVGDRGLLVGIEFARNMNLRVGDTVSIYSPEELKKFRQERQNAGPGGGPAEQGATNGQLARGPVGSRPAIPDKTNEGNAKAGRSNGQGKTEAILPDEYDVRGIFDVGYFEYNVSFVVASLRDAQSLWVLGTNVHGLTATLKDPYQAPVVQAELEHNLGPEYRITSWMEENAGILGALVVEKNVMFYLLFFIMIVAALCILSALITFVVQKTREIGMLKALGATDLQVSGLFLSQSGFVGIVGVAAGLGLGMLALHYRNEFLHFMNRLTGFELFPKSIYEFSELPALIVPRDILLICGSALFICLLGGLIPAWRAGRLKPVEALRYE